MEASNKFPAIKKSPVPSLAGSVLRSWKCLWSLVVTLFWNVCACMNVVQKAVKSKQSNFVFIISNFEFTYSFKAFRFSPYLPLYQLDVKMLPCKLLLKMKFNLIESLHADIRGNKLVQINRSGLQRKTLICIWIFWVKNDIMEKWNERKKKSKLFLTYGY